MALQSTDLILVNRATLTYKMPGSAILDPINTAQTTANDAKAKAEANEAAIAQLTASSFAVPTGGVIYTASQTVPTGFLPCDGASYSRITYPNLFAAITYIYGGTGDSFNVPDLRSRFLMGYDNSEARGYGTYQESGNKSHFHNVNQTSGENSVNHTHAANTVENGNHQHQYSSYVTDASSATAGTSGFWQNEQLQDTSVAGSHTHTVLVGDNSVNHTHALVFNTEADGLSQGRPENLNMYAIIKT
jgi:microcystin-dependent protein